MENRSEMLDLAEKYLIQQADLYGSDFYLEVDLKGEQAFESVEEFHHQIKDCRKCRLAESRTRFVFGTGNPKANLLCVGEAPGFEEDKQGEPFVGAAGQLLNRILAAIGFQRQEVYIANIVKCRPPGNRNPEADEVAECLPYLRRQIDLINPKLILALGRVAAKNLLGLDEPMAKLRGRVHHLDSVKVIVTYHPAALLRNPQWKRDTWEDVKKMREFYDREVGDKPPIQLK